MFAPPTAIYSHSPGLTSSDQYFNYIQDENKFNNI